MSNAVVAHIKKQFERLKEMRTRYVKSEAEWKKNPGLYRDYEHYVESVTKLYKAFDAEAERRGAVTNESKTNLRLPVR